MRPLRFAVYWLRYLLALAVSAVVILIALPLGALVRIGAFAEKLIDALGELDVFPASRGKACKACRGYGRVHERPEWNENDTPAAARRRGAGPVPKETDS